MSDFEHRVLTPYEVGRQLPIGQDPIRFRTTLLSAWLIDAINQDVTTLYPARSCHGFSNGWADYASGFARYEQGIMALSAEVINELTASSTNGIQPEPLTKIHCNGGSYTEQIGYGVTGMGQEFEVIFYQGTSHHPEKLPVPNDYWFLQGVVITTGISA